MKTKNLRSYECEPLITKLWRMWWHNGKIIYNFVLHSCLSINYKLRDICLVISYLDLVIRRHRKKYSGISTLTCHVGTISFNRIDDIYTKGRGY